MPSEAHTSRSEALAASGAASPPTGLPPDQRQQMKLDAEAQIDEFMRKVGYSKPAERTDERGWRWLKLGSADGRVGVIESEDQLFLVAESAIMLLPSDKDLILPLMRELLELNLRIPVGTRFGIRDEVVFIALTRSLRDLHAGDFAECINTVMAIADKMDNLLMKKYGGTSKKRVTPK